MPGDVCSARSVIANVVKLIVFLAFLILGMRAARAAGPQRRRAIQALLLYLVALNAAVGVTQRDSWPFPTYPLVPNIYDVNAINARLDYYGVTQEGREVPIDPYVWSPIFQLGLDLWFRLHYPHLDATQKEQALAFLRDRAAEGIQQLSRGERIGWQRVLGPLALPDWWLYVRPPRYGGTIRGLRVYRMEWRASERYRDPNLVKRTLVGESLR